MRAALAVLGATAALVAGCTWVRVTSGGAAVRAGNAAEVSGCRYLGNVTTNVLAKVTFVSRRNSKVEEELLVLAKNEAATMEGDTVVAAGPPSDGRQRFAVYRCGEL